MAGKAENGRGKAGEGGKRKHGDSTANM